VPKSNGSLTLLQKFNFKAWMPLAKNACKYVRKCARIYALARALVNACIKFRNFPAVQLACKNARIYTRIYASGIQDLGLDKDADAQSRAVT
jgi:hypothetical protein